MLNHCAERNNKLISEYTLATLCDLSNAFDVISHKIILQKLNNYGIRGITNKWFENYISQRTQYVELDNCKSSTKDTNKDQAINWYHLGGGGGQRFVMFFGYIYVSKARKYMMDVSGV